MVSTNVSILGYDGHPPPEWEYLQGHAILLNFGK